MTLPHLVNLKNLLFVVALVLALCHSNTAYSKGTEGFDAGINVGAGRQYSGIFGAQLFLGYKRVRVHAGMGFLIFSAGADIALTKHFSTGVYSYVGFASSNGAGGHLTYHLNSAFSKGFSVGVTVTNVCHCYHREPDVPDYTDTMISIGYEF